MKFFYGLILTLLLAVPAQAAECTYDQSNSQLDFISEHLGLVTMKGRFEKFTGSFSYDHTWPEKTRVELRIETGSVTSENPRQTRDLKSDDFFWPEKYPQITFHSREIQNIDGATRFDIIGDLTIRGITKEVIFKTQLLSEIDASGLPEEKLLFRTEAKIKREDFDLGKKNWMNPILKAAGENVWIRLHVEGDPVNPGPVHAES